MKSKMAKSWLQKWVFMAADCRLRQQQHKTSLHFSINRINIGCVASSAKIFKANWDTYQNTSTTVLQEERGLSNAPRPHLHNLRPPQHLQTVGGKKQRMWQKSKLLAERHEPAAATAAAAALDYISKAWGSGKVSESDSGSIRQHGTEGQELSWSALRAECWGSPASATALREFDHAEMRQKSWLVKMAACPFGRRWEEGSPPDTSEF